jgi:hypothetical protein
MPSVEDKQLLYLPLERAWRIAKNSQDLVPRLMPQVFSSIDLVQGDGSVGSVYEITMGPGTISCHVLSLQLRETEEYCCIYSA